MKKILLSASAAALLLGSCSKDSAELAPAVKGGETAFIAGMTIDNADETRLGFVDEGSAYSYVWDQGDMVGVSTGVAGENIPFISKLGGSTAAFEAVEEDLSYLGKGTYYMVYPYNKDTKFTTGADDVINVGMSIPSVQRYRDNSIATMTAPAVAVEKEYAEGKLITFYPVASYIRIPVKGLGTLKKLTMELTDKNDAVVKLSGAGTVDLSKEGKDLVFELTEDSAEDNVCIDFGKGGLKLSYTDAKNLVFVIPAGIDMDAVNFKFTAKLDDVSEDEVINLQMGATKAPYKTKPNGTIAVDKLLTLTLGLEGKTIIADADDLLRYVYAINKGVDAAKNDANLSNLVINDENKFKTALIINDIDCSTINDKLLSQVPTSLKAAYDWYVVENKVDNVDGKNIGSFKFPASDTYAIEGGLTKASTIKNMCVTTDGNGIFNNINATVNNIVLDNASVYVKNETLTKEDYAIFFANENPANFENLTIKGGKIEALEGTDFGDAALMGSVAASKLGENEKLVDGCPLHGEKEILVAKSLNIDADVDLTNYVATAPKFGEINGGEPGKQITVKDVALDDVKASIMAIIAETENAKYFSVMFTEGSTTTSLWTGLKGNFTDGQIRTAEDLVAAVAELETADVTAALKNNIDLLGKKWISVDNAINAITIDGNKFTLRNVNITNYAYDAEKKENVIDDVYALTAAHTFSVFGKEADVTSLNVEGLTIDIIGGEVNEEEGEILGEVSVGGLALEGAANYVNLTGATIKVADDVNLKKEDDKKTYIGGIMTKKTGTSVNNTAVVTFTHPEGTVTNPYFAR